MCIPSNNCNKKYQYFPLKKKVNWKHGSMELTIERAWMLPLTFKISDTNSKL